LALLQKNLTSREEKRKRKKMIFFFSLPEKYEAKSKTR
jgi:hypothetical protein